mgnify:CR=1 FL=1
MSDIPIIDVSAMATTGAAHRRLIDDFATAYGETGFAYITGHGIAPDLMGAVFDASKAFHALPLTEKLAIRLNRYHRGYIPINTSTDVTTTLAKVTRPNQSASFMMMREDAEHDPKVYLSGPNQWLDLAHFRPVLETYSREMTRLARNLTRVALSAAGADPAAFIAAFDPPTLWLRLLHYPPAPPQSPDDLFGSAPHRDFGCLTLLAQDQVGGLEVMTPDGDWLGAPYLEGSFVVNVGDMLHRLSNGRLRSTPHRVINRSGRERYSVPFFFDPHVNTEIKPLNGTGTPGFAPILFGDFLRGELEAGYDDHKPAPGVDL